MASPSSLDENHGQQHSAHSDGMGKRLLKMSMTRPIYPLCLGIAALLLLCLCYGLPANAQTITRGPYLQMGTPQTTTIVWRTQTATDAKVWYGSSPQQLTTTVVSTTKATQHEIKLTGLKPDTLYYYAVGTSTKRLGGGTSEYYFRTAPLVGSTKKFRFWVVGDSGTGGQSQRAVRDSMLNYVGKSKPDIYLHMGDMAYNDGKDDEFQRNFFNVYQNILRNTVCWPTMGNHEGRTSRSGPQSGPYYTAYVLPKKAEAGGIASGTEAYYSFDYANVHFVVLDSYDSSRVPSGAMLKWLKQDLASTRQRWVIAYWHHPPYTKGSHDSDRERQLIDMRRYALPILEAAGVDLVLGGHSHIYERSYLIHGAYETPSFAQGKIVDKGDGKLSGKGPYKKTSPTSKGAVYVVAGHGGAGVSQKGTHPLMYITEKANGSCIVDVQGDKLTLVNLRSDGRISDSFTMMKGAGLVVQSPNGGESYAFGEPVTIQWFTSGTVAKVKLSYSLDNGKTWKVIANSIANNGSYRWIVPGVASSQALVRVSDAGNSSSYDDSNGTFSIASAATRNYIKFGSTWKYYDKGKDLGTSWLTLSYNDSSWPSGPGQLGYGDNDEATRLTQPTPRHPSIYFRKKVKITGTVQEATLTVLHDDGVIVWINGKRVFGKYDKNGDSYSAWASSTSNDDEVSRHVIPTSALPFVSGDNIVAVMIKQRSSTSSDVSFDFGMQLKVASAPPKFAPIPKQQIQEEKTLTFQVQASHPQNLALTYSTEGTLPNGAVFEASTRTFRWTPKRGQSGRYLVTFKTTASNTLSATTSVEVTVQPAPPLPEPGPEPTLPDATPNEKPVTKDTATTPEQPATNDRTIGPEGSPRPEPSAGTEQVSNDSLAKGSSACGCNSSSLPSMYFWLLCILAFFVVQLRRRTL